MAMKHWENEEVITQVIWNAVNEIANIAEHEDKVGEYLGFDEAMSVRASEGEPAIFFEVNGGDDTVDGYDIVLEVKGGEELVGETKNVSFVLTDDVRGEIVSELDVTKREVDGVTVHAVDPESILHMLDQWFGRVVTV